jgi:hypothetical protein
MEEQFVYGLTMWGGLEYLSGFVPEQISEIHMIAGADNVLAPFRTMVYFWPITGEYMADWATKREPVTGVLEVLKEGRVIESIPLTRFTLRYPEGFASPIVELLTGDEAVAAYEEYRKAVEDFNEAAAQYERARREHDARISEMFRAMREEGRTYTRDEIPEPPAEPVPPSYYVQSIREAFVINLPSGRYTGRMVQNGVPIPGSEKTLAVFGPRRSGLSCVVRPEESWTKPLFSHEEGHTLYLAERKPFYVQVFDAEEYNSYNYTRLAEPANPTAGIGAQNEFVWVITSPQRFDVKMAVYEGGRLVSVVDQRPYYVSQTQSAALGYTITEWEDSRAGITGTSPTFGAFRIDLPPGRYDLQVTTSSGEPVAGGRRDLREVHDIGGFWWIAFVPLLIGVCLCAARRYAHGAAGFRSGDAVSL